MIQKHIDKIVHIYYRLRIQSDIIADMSSSSTLHDSDRYDDQQEENIIFDLMTVVSANDLIRYIIKAALILLYPNQDTYHKCQRLHGKLSAPVPSLPSEVDVIYE